MKWRGAVGNVLVRLRIGLTWENMPQVKEIVEKDLREDGKKLSYYKLGKTATLFDRAVNSPTSLGESSRHGTETWRPPASPMDLATAQAFIRELVRKWIGDKQP